MNRIPPGCGMGLRPLDLEHLWTIYTILTIFTIFTRESMESEMFQTGSRFLPHEGRASEHNGEIFD